MKILHINTLDHGGAAKAAIRLHKAMLASGLNSTFLSLGHTDLSIPNHVVYKDVYMPASGWQKWKKLNPVHLFKRFFKLKKWKRNEEIRKFAEGKMEYISFHETPYRIHEINDFATYDVIHLHWISDFVDWPTFFPAVQNKKIVWSLHDMAPFTGGYHYSNGYEGYVDRDGNAPFLKNTQWENVFEQELLAKCKVLSGLKLDLHIVGLSNWMRTCAARSKLFNSYHSYVIPNLVDMDIFKPMDKNAARAVYNLPLNKKIIVFVSEQVENVRKGFDLVVFLMDYLKERTDIVFVFVGNSAMNRESVNVIELGFIRSQKEIALVLNAADVVLLPSREDNLPNVALESLMCGTPVVANNIGGMPDLIFNPILGLLAETKEELCRLLDKQLLQMPDKQIVHKTMLQNFKPDTIVNRYLEIYTKSN